MSRLKVTRLTSAIGARIEGVDLTGALDEAVKESIRQALAKHSVLVFKGQPVDDEQQKAVAAMFGPLTASPSRRLFDLNDPVRTIERVVFAVRDEGAIPHGPQREDFQGWHVDDGFCAQIPKAATLRPIALAEEGGDTCWASMGAAFDGLSPAMQAWLETLNAVNSCPPNFRATVGFYDLPEERRRRFEEEEAVRVHPVVVRHPVTGRRSLFVSPIYTDEIEGLTRRESTNLLRFLFSEATRPAVVYRHCWEMGDLVIWDELATLHCGPEKFAPERQLVRIYGGLVTPSRVGPAQESLAMSA